MEAAKERRLPWLWQAATSAVIVALLGGVKPMPQAVLVAALVLVCVVQRAFPTSRVATALRTCVLVASTWLAVAAVVTFVALAATPPQEHPDMPIGEVFLGVLAASVASAIVLWLRVRRRDRWSIDESDRAPAPERRLALVVELFTVAAAVRAALDVV